MNDQNAHIWLIDETGKKKGPFTIKEVQQMMTHGDIPPHQKVVSDLSSYSTLTLANQLKTMNDPTLSLFDALQSARNKQSHAKDHPPLPGKPPTSSFWKKLFFLALFSGVLIGALIFWFKRDPNPETEAAPPSPPASSESPEQTPPPEETSTPPSGPRTRPAPPPEAASPPRPDEPPPHLDEPPPPERAEEPPPPERDPAMDNPSQEQNSIQIMPPPEEPPPPIVEENNQPQPTE